MLRAMPAILDAAPGVRLFVAGSPGRQSRELDHLRDSLSLRDAVDFLGPRTDVYDLLAAADVFVLPSRREGMPGALLEAMALEAPVVASDIDPVREVVAGDMAFLVPPGDPSRLAQAVVGILDDRSAAVTRALRALDRFEASYTIERSATGMIEFYRTIVG
jgi:glycosyltransferase involved in cell wall biosynthesis